MCFTETPPEGRRTVLVVDDDPAFCFFMVEALTRANYVVRAAENGRQALTLLEDMRFDAVVTDIYMPVADAIDLVRAMRQGYPDVPVIVVSGDYVRDHGVLRFLGHLGARHFLAKPFLPEHLAEAVRAALAPAPAASGEG